MNIAYSERSMAALDGSRLTILSSKSVTQARLLAANLHHRSLRAKKYDKANDIWQARVNRAWRFYFTIEGDTYRIQNIVPHPK